MVLRKQIKFTDEFVEFSLDLPSGSALCIMCELVVDLLPFSDLSFTDEYIYVSSAELLK